MEGWWLLLAVAGGLWFVALFEPALRDPAGGAGGFHYNGLHCLLLGWLGIFGRLQWILPWSANVLFGISLSSGVLRRQSGRTALLLSLTAIPLGLVTLVNRSIEVNEAGDKTAVVPGPGFYLWMSSLAALAAAQWFKTR